MRNRLFCSLAVALWTVTLASCGGVSSRDASLTPQQKVAAAKTDVTIAYGNGDTSSSVTKNMTLPVVGADGTTISWSSSDTALVSTTGVVTRPLTQDANVTLMATISIDGISDTKTFTITVKAQMTEAQAVAAAKAALTIGYASGDSATSVTQNLTLPAAGIDGSTVAWESNASTVVSNAGAVSRPSVSDATVTLTATITVGASSDSKDFPITVIAQMTAAQAVAAAKAALEIGYQSGDADSTVTRDLSLPTTGANNCSIAWSSSDPAISSTGKVTQPVGNDLPVTLTATITCNGASDTKDFIVVVKAQMTDAEAVAAAKQALVITYADGDSAVSVTQKVGLPSSGSSNCAISWSSNNQNCIVDDGTVQRPSIGSVQVILTATITSHSVSDTASFTLTVIGQMSDEDAVADAKANLNIGYALGDSAANVTGNLILPGAGKNACALSWHSDTKETISDSGVVTQPSGDPVAVTLTATITSHAYSDTKDFVLTVQPVPDDTAVVAADKAELTIGYGPGDGAGHVAGNIDLPTSGTHGSNISWASSNPAMISNSGGVTVPTDNDANVTMTATITYGLASDTQDFPVTVKALLLSEWVNPAAISPGNGAIEVDPGIVVRIPFQLSLNSATVDDTTFQLLKTSNSENIPIIVAYDAPSKTVSLTPQAPLAEETQYSTVVSTALRDANDNSLPTAMGFSFTTLSYVDILSQWKFNGDGTDASGKGNDLLNINGTFETDAVHEGSTSLYLNGQNATSNINLGTQLTVAVWVNVDNPIRNSINTIMANANTGESANGFKLCINRWNTSDESVVIEVGDGLYGGKWITPTGLIQPGSWYHLAFVIDQPNQLMKIYYNGAEAPLHFASDEGRLQANFRYDFKTSGPFLVGTFPGNSYPFKGHLDDMRVYNRVLSDDEIAKIAQEK